MTRSALDTTLRRAYLVLGIILFISIAAKLAPLVPGIAGTPLERFATAVYDYFKDMSLVLVTVVAAYLANVFQKRSKFIERLEEEWRGIVRTKSALYAYCEKPNGSAEDYWEWSQHPNGKPIIIPAGTSNGLAIKSTTAIANAGVLVNVEFTETSF